MAEAQELAGLLRSRQIEQIARAKDPKSNDCTEIVLEAYTSTRLQDAFEAAVRVYRERNPGTTLNAGPRAVAEIICRRGYPTYRVRPARTRAIRPSATAR